MLSPLHPPPPHQVAHLFLLRESSGGHVCFSRCSAGSTHGNIFPEAPKGVFASMSSQCISGVEVSILTIPTNLYPNQLLSFQWPVKNVFLQTKTIFFFQFCDVNDFLWRPCFTWRSSGEKKNNTWNITNMFEIGICSDENALRKHCRCGIGLRGREQYYLVYIFVSSDIQVSLS